MQHDVQACVEVKHLTTSTPKWERRGGQARLRFPRAMGNGVDSVNYVFHKAQGYTKYKEYQLTSQHRRQSGIINNTQFYRRQRKGEGTKEQMRR